MEFFVMLMKVYLVIRMKCIKTFDFINVYSIPFSEKNGIWKDNKEVVMFVQIQICDTCESS
jgi:hypothetical protein